MGDSLRTPLKALRLKCLDCCLGQAHEVRLCPCKDCPHYASRFGRKPKNQMPKLTVLKAIRARCLDCSAYEPSRVRECEFKKCALYPYRMGKNPKRAGIGGNPQLMAKLASTGDATDHDHDEASETAA